VVSITSASSGNSIAVDANGNLRLTALSQRCKRSLSSGNNIGQLFSIDGTFSITGPGIIQSTGVGKVQVNTPFNADGGFTFVAQDEVDISKDVTTTDR